MVNCSGLPDPFANSKKSEVKNCSESVKNNATIKNYKHLENKITCSIEEYTNILWHDESILQVVHVYFTSAVHKNLNCIFKLQFIFQLNRITMQLI